MLGRTILRFLRLVTAALVMTACVPHASANLVHVNARSTQGVTLNLAAGTYVVKPASTTQGGVYDGWNAWGSTTCADPQGCLLTSPTTVTGWLNRFVVESLALTTVSVEGVPLLPSTTPPGHSSGYYADGNERYYRVGDGYAYPTPADAAAHALTSVFTISAPAVVTFRVLDTQYSDNAGGISLRVFPVPGPPCFVHRDITTQVDGPRSVFAADIDGDGDVDALSASINDDMIAWYENDGDTPPGFTQHVITTLADYAFSVFAADLDGDGDVDVCSASHWDDTIAWYENDGAMPPAFSRHVITTLADGAWSVFAADVDGDDDIDVLSASIIGDTIEWYENDGAPEPTFTRRVIGTVDNAQSVFAADIDGDDDIDVIAIGYTLAWFENDGAMPPGFTPHVIAPANSGQVVHAADMDGDGDADLLTAVYFDSLTWYENDGGSPPTMIPHPVSAAFDGANFVCPADMDDDGDTDILTADKGGGIVWFESDGATPPQFATRHNLIAPGRAVALSVADLDGDGDVDTLAGRSFNADRAVEWLENASVQNATAGVRFGDFETAIAAAAPNDLLLAGPGSFAALCLDDLQYNGKPLLIASAGSIELRAGTTTTLAPNAGLQCQGDLTANGSLVLATDSSVECGGSLDVNAQLIVPAGTAQMSGQSVTFRGEVTLEQGSALTVMADAGQGQVVVRKGCTIRGAGSLAPLSGMLSAGTAAPDPGMTLTIDGDYVQQHDAGSGPESGELVIDLADASAPTTLAVTGAADLHGRLRISADPGIMPPPNSIFPVVTAASITGQFDFPVLPYLGADRLFTLTSNAAGARGGASVDLYVVDLAGDVEIAGQRSNGLGGPYGLPRAATLADIDNDGDDDLLIAIPDPINPQTTNGVVVILYNADDGDLTNGWEGFEMDTQLVNVGIGKNPSGIAVGRIDNNPQPDIIVSNEADDTISVLLISNPNLGSFNALPKIIAVGAAPADVAVADLDRDGGLDIATANSGADSVSIVWNSRTGSGGTWTFDTIDDIDLPDCPTSIRPGDFDADIYRPFLAMVCSGDDSVNFIVPHDDRTADVLPPLSVDDEPVELVLTDLNADGVDDLATANRAGSSVSVALNTTNAGPTLTFGTPSSLPIDGSPRSITAGNFDANADEDNDLAVIAGGVVKILRNDLDAGMGFTAYPNQPAGADPLILRTADLNNDGGDDLIAVSQSTAARADPVTILLTAPAPCPGDIDRSGVTDVFDFAAFANAFESQPGDANWNPEADLDGDAVVSVYDFGIFAINWECVLPAPP